MAKQRAYSQSLTGDGDSPSWIVQGATDADSAEELLHFSLSGSFNSATVTIYTSVGATSPVNWAAAASGAFTSAVSDVIRLPQNSLIKFTVSGAGSPVPAITAEIRGQLALA